MYFLFKKCWRNQGSISQQCKYYTHTCCCKPGICAYLRFVIPCYFPQRFAAKYLYMKIFWHFVVRTTPIHIRTGEYQVIESYPLYFRCAKVILILGWDELGKIKQRCYRMTMQFVLIKCAVIYLMWFNISSMLSIRCVIKDTMGLFNLFC